MTHSSTVLRTLFVVGLIALGGLLIVGFRTLSASHASAAPTVTSTTTVSATATVTPAPPVPAAGEPCATARLRAGVVPDLAPSEASGIYHLDLVLTNIGPVSCTIGGFPKVQLVGDRDGTTLGLSATDSATDQGASGSTTLDPGESQAVALQLDESTTYTTDSTCDEHYADGLRVYPPGESTSLFAAASGLIGCATTSYSILSVGAFGND